ncbi:hypothetical protein AC481_07025 [miscellaneous Crenarchaeota group archaeon SMTZ-80]|nr:MAG: hypothetical protein AC481_07025 [miscellaneous Crenarchaeota group archaeon SMTZ-80]
MIKAKHHFLIYPFFVWLTLFLLKRRFHQINIIGEFNNENKPTLIIANHISWWDGFWIAYLNEKKIHRKIHFMMLEEQLKKHWYFNYCGGYSVRKKTHSIIESLEYTVDLLNIPQNMVLMFPQGEIKSMHEQEIIFEQGIQRVLQKVSKEIQIVLVANIVDYFSNPKPSLYMYIKGYSGSGLDKLSLESEYNAFYQTVLNSQKKLEN